MEEKNRRERLELNQDLKVTRSTWRFERIGWIGLTAFVAAALAGLLGPGPLSEASAGEGSFRVDYQRFAHFENEADLEFELQPAVPGRDVELWLSAEYLRNIEVRGVTPPPTDTRLEGGRQVYRYETRGEGPLSVHFDILYRTFGRVRGAAGIVGGASTEFTHWVYP